MAFEVEHTYWGHKGKYQATSEKLAKLIPLKGAVSGPALDAFRQATNCYYDLYNNGLCNRHKEFVNIFGFDPFEGEEDEGVELTDRIASMTETVVGYLIIKAAKEQGIEVQ